MLFGHYAYWVHCLRNYYLWCIQISFAVFDTCLLCCSYATFSILSKESKKFHQQLLQSGGKRRRNKIWRPPNKINFVHIFPFPILSFELSTKTNHLIYKSWHLGDKKSPSLNRNQRWVDNSRNDAIVYIRSNDSIACVCVCKGRGGGKYDGNKIISLLKKC